MANKSDDGEQDAAGEYRPDTRLVLGGRDPFSYHGFVNPPVYHASTVLYQTAEDLVAHRSRYQYGRRGTPTTEALEGAIRAIEGPGCAGVAVYTPEGTEALFNELMPPGFRLVRSAAKGWENVSAMPRRTSLQRATPPCA